MERSITFFASHVSTAKMLLASTFARQGASWRDEQGIVRVENRSASAAVIALALARTRFATLTLSLKWQINVISALRPDWQKAFRPFASVPARNTH